MKIDLNNMNPGTWFPFPDGSGRILQRTLSLEEIENIQNKTTVKRYEYKGGRRYEYTDFIPGGEELQQEMMWDLAIMDWEGLESADDVKIECTRENKINLMRKSSWFARNFKENNDTLEELETKQQGNAIKNSPSTQPGSKSAGKTAKN